ncbi:PDDEXK nuclease domain-containing protein [Arthrobacter gyeryongensis]|uniref:PDDEXK nuclease domain-containing protein n=1 Tax=Arthrobacter gyeryongensis TaxID=1650592 RepID=UPI0031E79C93
MELKAGKFRPEHLGRLNFYVAAVNDMLRLPRQAPTVGIWCAGPGTSALCATLSMVPLNP